MSLPEWIVNTRVLLGVDVIADLSGEDIQAGTDVLPEDYEVDYRGWARIQIIPSSDTIVYVKINGSIGALNSGNTLTAGNIYEFDVTVKHGDRINIRLSTAQTSIPLLRILSIPRR